MKSKGSIFKKRFALVLSIFMLIGLLPLQVVAAETETEDVLADISILAMKGPAGVAANLYNNTSEEFDADLIFAAYDENGKLDDFLMVPLTVDANSSSGSQKFVYDFKDEAKRDNDIKIFIWDSQSFIPQDVSDFLLVTVDDAKKTGVVQAVETSGDEWVYTEVDNVDVIIAFKPEEVSGSVLPDLEMFHYRKPVGNKGLMVDGLRVIVTP